MPAIDLEAIFSEIVVEEELPQVLRMHPLGHAGGIGIPGHEIVHGFALAHQVMPDEP